MVPWNSASGGFAYIWQSKCIGIIAIKTEGTDIHFLSDVLVAVHVVESLSPYLNSWQTSPPCNFPGVSLCSLLFPQVQLQIFSVHPKRKKATITIPVPGPIWRFFQMKIKIQNKNIQVPLFYLSHYKLVSYVESWEMLNFPHDLLVFKIWGSFLQTGKSQFASN